MSSTHVSKSVVYYKIISVHYKICKHDRIGLQEQKTQCTELNLKALEGKLSESIFKRFSIDRH